MYFIVLVLVSTVFSCPLSDEWYLLSNVYIPISNAHCLISTVFSYSPKIYGRWVLAAAFADFEAGLEMIANISTSHLDLSLNSDRNTIHYKEMNKDL